VKDFIALFYPAVNPIRKLGLVPLEILFLPAIYFLPPPKRRGFLSNGVKAFPEPASALVKQAFAARLAARQEAVLLHLSEVTLKEIP